MQTPWAISRHASEIVSIEDSGLCRYELSVAAFLSWLGEWGGYVIILSLFVAADTKIKAKMSYPITHQPFAPGEDSITSDLAVFWILTLSFFP